MISTTVIIAVTAGIVALLINAVLGVMLHNQINEAAIAGLVEPGAHDARATKKLDRQLLIRRRKCAISTFVLFFAGI